VLISLQSLIFVKDPYYNEPGYESRQSTREAELYNQNVRLNAMKHALLAPLKNPPRAFQDVIKEHFKLKKGEIVQQVDDWINRADSAHKEACMQVAAQIKEELEKLVETGGRVTEAT
jgi:baculoviral IAP repeat-containing protein 6